MDLKQPYLTSQLIAYIGNKRRLLPLINEALETIETQFEGEISFFDGFAGSGSVSRLAKSKGYRVYSNDWEEYSKVLNSALIGETEESISELFPSDYPLNKVIDELNQLPDPLEKDQYLTKYYAPAAMELDKADFKHERLFFTRQNALRLDAIRNRIETLYPESDQNKIQMRRKNILLAVLLYKAATHNNTSGIFKACHKGFGGYNGDALSRITRKIEMEAPILLKGNLPASEFFKEDIDQLVTGNKLPHVSIAYLDPPYNQHQYGSNYHLLNTIARWDKIPAPLDLNDKGELKEKAAIRKDWIETRSPYCYKDTAATHFEAMLMKLKATEILLSYSSDGIIPFEQMLTICEKKGRISIFTNEYTKFRGGRQSNSRVQTNIEFIIRISTQQQSRPEDRILIDNAMLRKKALLLSKKQFKKKQLYQIADKIEPNLDGKKKTTTLTFKLSKKNSITAQTSDGFNLKLTSTLNNLSRKETEKLIRQLSTAICQSKEDELQQLLIQVQENPNSPLAKKLPPTLKKLAHKKYKSNYQNYLKQIQKILPTLAEKEKITKAIENIDIIAAKRFL